ncbi:MAG: aspartate--tRNA(Asn) ligase, partial [Candidatus Pacebacteria bacterium]|nr:aspartate--tRNA(Asn) ligase [Candidatus Paceibacterota bacterium]
FIDDHRDVMDMLTKVIKSMVTEVEQSHGDTLKDFGVDIPLVPSEIPFMKLSEAQEVIKKETGEDCIGEPDLEPSHERFLCEYANKELKSDFIFITHYPVSKRPFYTYEDENDKGFTKSFDLLFRGVEIVSGGQRVHNYAELIEKITAKGLDPKAFEFYLQAFKYGMPPHGGIGMGLERLTEKFLGIGNVREASLFPRDMNRIDALLSK